MKQADFVNASKKLIKACHDVELLAIEMGESEVSSAIELLSQALINFANDIADIEWDSAPADAGEERE